jgi:uncharacterized protein (TIGR01777 family)
MATYLHSSVLPATTASEVFAWHTAPGALQRLVPPAAGIRVVRNAPLAEGSEVELSVPVGPCRRRWLARHSAVQAPHGFTDEQISGPFPAWHHEHRFVDSPEGVVLTDAVTYTPPGGPVSGVVDWVVAQDLRRTFAWRHERTRRDLERQHLFRAQPRLTVGISGASGLVAGELIPFLTTAGHHVRPFTRRAETVDSISWDPLRGRLDEAGLSQCDAIVHLAGATVAQRWTSAAMAEIRDSRIAGTRLIAEALARNPGTVRTLIIASGINVYPQGENECTEETPSAGSGFLAEVVRAWEAAAEPARQAGIRVVHLRIGMVLSSTGGALKQLLTPTKFGLGGPVAGGNQWLSWIELDDLVGLIHHALFEARMSGPINATAPEPVRQGDFAEILGRVLHRPAAIPFPGWAVRLLLGQMGEELLLPSLRVVPRQALQAGFIFRSPDLLRALRFALQRG